MFLRIIVWFNTKTNEYYYRKYIGFYNDYYVGYRNQYDHEVIMIIELPEFIKKKTIKDKIVSKFIQLLQKV